MTLRCTGRIWRRPTTYARGVQASIGSSWTDELKREYQQFLQERNRGREDSDGRPDRDVRDREWAREHDLPCDVDGHVEFPDARIEYEDADGRGSTPAMSRSTPHYRGGHGASARRSGVHGFPRSIAAEPAARRCGPAPDAERRRRSGAGLAEELAAMTVRRNASGRSPRWGSPSARHGSW